MFAFALWDIPRRKLLAARDRFGIKPLYLARTASGVAIASECKVLFAAQAVTPRPDLPALDSFFTHRFVKGPHTAFAGVECLPPGQYVIWEDDRLRGGAFWNPMDIPSLPGIDLGETVEEYGRLLQAAVESQLISDVPLGMFLSGGLDSSVICASMGAHGGQSPRTFTIGFENQADERDQAQHVADRLRAVHTAFTMTAKDLAMLPRLQWHLDNPFGDAIVLPTYVLAREARRKASVVLTGEGADETFGGYIHQKALWRLSRFPLAQGLGGRLLGQAVKCLPVSWLDTLFEYPASMGVEGRNRLARLLASGNAVDRYYNFVSLFTSEEKERLYTPAMAEAARFNQDRDVTAALLAHQGLDFFQRLILLELTSWLPDNILFKIDKICMACGLEGRFPFLDNHLAQFALGLPRALKLSGGQSKVVLREVGKKLLPGLLGGSKKSFFFSVAAMFPATYKSWLDTVLTQERIERTGVMNWEYVRKLKDRAREPGLLTEKQIISLVCLVEWYDQFFAQA